MYDNQDIQEKAPPGAKYERMVKHIKNKYAQDGLTDKEKAIAYATAWKKHGKTRSEDYMMVKKDGSRVRMPGDPPRAKKEPGGYDYTPTKKQRAAMKKQPKTQIGSRFDHFELEGDSLQEKYLYTYLYERNYDALDKDMDGDKDFADVMIARMVASGKSREEAIKATMSKEYNKTGRKIKISDEFSDWRDDLGEALSKKSPFVDVMPKNDAESDSSESIKAARKRQKPNENKAVTEETLEEFADLIGGHIIEAEQLDEFAGALVRAVTTLAKSPAARSAIAKGPRAFVPRTVPKPTVPKPNITPGTKPATPLPVKPVPTPVKPGTKPAPAPAPGTKPAPSPAPGTKPAPSPAPGTKPAPSPAPGTKKSIPGTALAVGTAAATAAAVKTATDVLLDPLTKTGTGSPVGGGGPGGGGPEGDGPGRLSLPKLKPYRGIIGSTVNPQ
jgi:hypothetical protein